MYEVWVLTQDLFKMAVSDGNGTMLFDTDTEAWDMVAEIMQHPHHPRFAWVTKEGEERRYSRQS